MVDCALTFDSRFSVAQFLQDWLMLHDLVSLDTGICVLSGRWILGNVMKCQPAICVVHDDNGLPCVCGPR